MKQCNLVGGYPKKKQLLHFPMVTYSVRSKINLLVGYSLQLVCLRKDVSKQVRVSDLPKVIPCVIPQRFEHGTSRVLSNKLTSQLQRLAICLVYEQLGQRSSRGTGCWLSERYRKLNRLSCILVDKAYLIQGYIVLVSRMVKGVDVVCERYVFEPSPRHRRKILIKRFLLASTGRNTEMMEPARY